MMETAKGADDPGTETGEKHDNEIELFESPRLHILRAAIECVIKKTIHSVSVQKLIDILQDASENKNITNYQTRIVSKIYSKLQTAAEELMKNDIDKYFETTSGILTAHELISKLPSEHTSESISTWRPTGDPYQDMRSHDAANQLKYHAMLQEMVESQEAEIQCLKQHISQGRLMVHNLMKSLVDLKKDCSALSSQNLALLEHFEEMGAENN